jgi:hypothetical protein
LFHRRFRQRATIWVQNPIVLEVSRRPALRGCRTRHTSTRGQAIVPLAFPRAGFRVAELLG